MQSVDGSDVDDLSSGTLLDHLRRGGLGEQEDASEIDGDDLVKITRFKIHDRNCRIDAGIIDQNVYTAIYLYCKSRRFSHTFLVRNISFYRGCLPTFFLERLGRLFCRFFIYICYNHIGRSEEHTSELQSR